MYINYYTYIFEISTVLCRFCVIHIIHNILTLDVQRVLLKLKSLFRTRNLTKTINSPPCILRFYRVIPLTAGNPHILSQFRRL